MATLRSTFDPRSDAAQANRAAMAARLTEIDGLLETLNGGGGPKYVDRHRGRGKLLPRERIALLLD